MELALVIVEYDQLDMSLGMTPNTVQGKPYTRITFLAIILQSTCMAYTRLCRVVNLI